jgi:hypothetical protein
VTVLPVVIWPLPLIAAHVAANVPIPAMAVYSERFANVVMLTNSLRWDLGAASMVLAEHQRHPLLLGGDRPGADIAELCAQV